MSVSLSAENYLYIFQFLSAKDLGRCAQVCKQWKEVTSDQRLWKHFFLRDLGHVSDSKTVKEDYIRLTKPSKSIHVEKISHIRISAGKIFFSNAEHLQVWDADKRTLLWRDNHFGSITCLEVYPEGVITGSYDTLLFFWDLETGDRKKTLIGHTDAVLCFKRLENQLISGAKNGNIVLWNLKKKGRVLASGFGKGEVVALAANKSKIFSAYKGNKNVWIWDKKGKSRGGLSHHQTVLSIEVANKFLISAAGEKIYLWDLKSKTVLRTFFSENTPFSKLVISEKWIAGIYVDSNLLFLVDREKFSSSSVNMHEGKITSIAVRGDEIVTGGEDRRVMRYNAKTGAQYTLGSQMEPITNVALDEARIVSTDTFNLFIWK